MTVDPLNFGRFISAAAAAGTVTTALAVLELSELLQRFLLAAIRSPRLTPSPLSPARLFCRGLLVSSLLSGRPQKPAIEVCHRKFKRKNVALLHVTRLHFSTARLQNCLI